MYQRSEMSCWSLLTFFHKVICVVAYVTHTVLCYVFKCPLYFMNQEETELDALNYNYHHIHVIL